MAGKVKKDYILALALVIVVAVFFVAVFPFLFSLRASHRFSGFKEEFTEAVNYARKLRCAEVTENGETAAVTANEVSRLYSMILGAGMGKEQKEAPETEPLLLDLGNGVRMEFRETKILEEARLRDDGVFICLQKEDGYRYQYDTDKFTIHSVQKHISQSD